MAGEGGERASNARDMKSSPEANYNKKNLKGKSRNETSRHTHTHTWGKKERKKEKKKKQVDDDNVLRWRARARGLDPRAGWIVIIHH